MEMIGKYIQERWKGFESKIKIKKRWAPLCCSFLSSFSLGCRPGPLLPLFIYSRAPRAALYHYEQFNLPSAYPLPSPLLLILLQINDRVLHCRATHTHTHTRTPSIQQSQKEEEKEKRKKTSAAPLRPGSFPPTSPLETQRESSSSIHGDRTTTNLPSIVVLSSR